jgi:signal recognition particle receptor subunit alpha
MYGEAPTLGDNAYMSESSEDEDEAPEKEGGGMFSFFKKLTGLGGALTKKDITPVLAAFKESLMAKNVAADIAEKLCQSVSSNLEGKKLPTFTSVKSAVKSSIEESLTRILTPKKSVDVLQGIMLAKAQNRPYKVVFCGVNGVGKSTSLSKIAAYFISKGLQVSMAACDTFRSGAIEQLKTHATALGTSLYSKGYNKDAASVAMDAVNQATRNGDDVLLIDTAGRMQDNDPLMRALAKLITVNEPDLVLFVGEALVGNDAVDQLSKFNRCLHDLSDNQANPRLIDGIVLTKFDTIDDKVGAAISMTYITGQPIMFVGVGQTYKDLRRMNVKLLIKQLLK